MRSSNSDRSSIANVKKYSRPSAKRRESLRRLVDIRAVALARRGVDELREGALRLLTVAGARLHERDVEQRVVLPRVDRDRTIPVVDRLRQLPRVGIRDADRVERVRK